MRGEGVSTLVALCVVSVGADLADETTAPPPATPDVDKHWLEGFRRELLRHDHTYGPAPARAPAGRPPDARRDGALSRDEHGDASQAQGSDDDAASRENGISRRDLRGPSREASLTDEEFDLPRKAFLDNLYELENQLRPVYVSSKKETGDGDAPIQSRKKNEEDVEESPPYIEQNGVRRYKVNMDRKQRLRSQFEDGLTWMQDVVTHELSAEDGQHGNEESEHTQQSQNDNEDRNYNQGRPQYEQEDNRGHENEQEQEASASRSEEESGENEEQAQELEASEYKQENLRSLYVGGGRDGGGGG